MEYKAITGENFYLNELKNTSQYIIENGFPENLRIELKKHDVLDCVSESNFNKKFFSINKRIISLTELLKKELYSTDVTTAKFINLYSILCSERFIAEFMDEVIREKYENFNYSLREGDFSNFLEHKINQSDTVNKWTEAAQKKMIIKVKNFLSEGGYIKKLQDKEYEIMKPIVDNVVINEIRENGNKNILKIMLY
ncbi:BrxA family protein [Fusobacterium sp. PH5-44]|uniref:BrxA family protein n=1 Tax=unclassified Fusobacterium TaxID=2648384 RepID=UPI003D1CE0AD